MGQGSTPFTSSLAGTIFIDETNEQIIVVPEDLIPPLVFGALPDGT